MAYFCKMNTDYEKAIFSSHSESEFFDLCLQAYQFQMCNNPVYRSFVNSLPTRTIQCLEDLPFLPISFFKTQKIKAFEAPAQQIFTSSGTTGMEFSSHYVLKISLYEKSFTQGFQHFYGNPSDYCILALLPSYLERSGSSLVFMMNSLIQQSKHPQSGFYLNNIDKLVATINNLIFSNQKILLIGVSFALLDLVEKYTLKAKNMIVMETGGMKGKRKELTREELHKYLCAGFGVSQIHSEYGMTELLSQGYSNGNGLYKTPPWMKVLVRDAHDPFSLIKTGNTGGINVIDLANIYSCPFIETQDLGKMHQDGSFEVLGRFDYSDTRGCNLLFA